MILLDRTYPTPEANLAFDEALIEVADQQSVEFENARFPEILRLWEMPTNCIVLGRASKRSLELHSDACEEDGIPIMRRVSGGATVVTGPGCLMYSALLSYEQRPSWRMLDVAHSEVMRRVGTAVQTSLDAHAIQASVEYRGTCDLTLQGRKFSGNALRCKRNWMLYHGTLLVHMSLDSLSRYLRQPPRQPEYRGSRSHAEFVINLMPEGTEIKSSELVHDLKNRLATQWNAVDQPLPVNIERQLRLRSEELLRVRYDNPTWNAQL